MREICAQAAPCTCHTCHRAPHRWCTCAPVQAAGGCSVHNPRLSTTSRQPAHAAPTLRRQSPQIKIKDTPQLVALSYSPAQCWRFGYW